VVQSARVILNFIIELQKAETPPSEATLGVRKVEDPPYRVMVGTDNKLFSFEVRAQA
jgi:hypothetical protein